LKTEQIEILYPIESLSFYVHPCTFPQVAAFLLIQQRPLCTSRLPGNVTAAATAFVAAAAFSTLPANERLKIKRKHPRQIFFMLENYLSFFKLK